MEIHDILERARTGTFEPVVVLVGPEHFLSERAAAALRAACVGDGPSGFNEDVFHGKGLAAQTIVSTARTVPMMARSRFILVRELDDMAPAELDKLAEYVDAPIDTTCLVALADKIDGRSKLAKVAKQRGVWVEAQPLKGGALRQFAVAEARARGHKLASEAADALVDATGADLAAIDDALERLSLYAGAGAAIDLAAVEACVTRVRVETIWALVDAVGMRDAKTALRAAGSLLADREPPLRILAMVARQLRIVAKMRDALSSGLRGQDAAREAGAPPFKANDLTESARRFPPRELAAAFAILAEADVALKSSKRPGDTILEEAILRLCRPRAGARAAHALKA